MASKSNGVESTPWARGPSPARTTNDPEEKTLLGPTPKRWGNLLLFIFIIYIILASQFSICLAAFHQRSINPRVKRQDYTLNRSSPGLEFRPRPPDARSTLISYKGNDYESFKYWEDQLIEFLSDYKKHQTAEAGQNLYRCEFQYPRHPGEVCNVDLRDFVSCIEENHFNYHKSAPCIFLKLDKINGWQPEFYNDTSSLPEDMPEDVKSEIKEITESYSSRVHVNMVWVSCEGETPTDRENIGPIKYFPNPGFPAYYFPYNNTEDYLSPLVAVQFVRPKTGVVINIECRAWAKNIQYNRKEHLGAVHFQLKLE